MNTVERVKLLCIERKTAISKLEKELGFANGYISQLRKGTFPDDRLRKIADYFNVSIEFLLFGEEQQKEKTPAPKGAEVNLGYLELNAENRAFIDYMIEKLIKSQSEN